MSQNINLIVYPSPNLEEGKTFFTEFLGTEPYADSQYYVGFKTDSVEVGLDPRAKEIVSYIEVSDIQESLSMYVELGATVHQPTKNIGAGMLIAQVKDPNGNILGLRQVEN